MAILIGADFSMPAFVNSKNFFTLNINFDIPMSILTRILQKLTSDKGPLHDNTFAKAILPFVEGLSLRITDSERYKKRESNTYRERLEESIWPIIIGAASAETSTSIQTGVPLQGKDCRIKRINLKGVRKYPSIDNRYYSVSMCNIEDKPCSSIFLGINGVGKSSIYCGLEWASLGYSDTANHRGFIKTEEVDEHKTFMSHLESDSDKDVRIILESIDEFFVNSLSQLGITIAFPSFFCMERDVEILSQGLDSVYISHQLGIFDFQFFIQTIDKMLIEREKAIDKYNEIKAALALYKTELWLTTRFDNLQKIDKKNLYTDIFNSGVLYSDPENPLTDKIAMSEYYASKIKGFISTLLPNEEEKDAPSKEEILRFFPPMVKAIYENTVSINDVNEIAREEFVRKLESAIEGIYLILNRWIDHSSPDIRISPGVFRRIKNRLAQNEKYLFELKLDKPLVEIDNSIIANIKKMQDALKNEYRNILNQLQQDANEVFKALFDGFFEPDLKSVKLALPKDSSFDVKVEVEVKPQSNKKIGNTSHSITTEPRLFLNTFRFKLFCVALKVALAFSCAKIHEFNFPIIMDDVFDSSDFSNRGRIRDFVEHLFKVHKKLFGEGTPLQLIFFTQDDVIGESVYRGIRRFEPLEGAKYSRIFPYNEVKDDEWKYLAVDENFKKENNIEDIHYAPVEDLIYQF